MRISNPLAALLLALLLAGCVAVPGGSMLPNATQTKAPETSDGTSTSITITTGEKVSRSVAVTYYILSNELTNVEVTYHNGTTTIWNVSNRGFPLSEVEDAKDIVPTEQRDVTIKVQVGRNETRKITISDASASAALVYTIHIEGEPVLVGAGGADCNKGGIKTHHISIQDTELYESSTGCYHPTDM